MIQADRKKLILKQLEREESVSIPFIAKQCKVSEITVRRDLDELDKKGLLIRTHGGATKKDTSHNLFSYEDKANVNKEKKLSICKAAASSIKENDVIYIDCGSTVYHLTKYISGIKNLKVITNSLPIVGELIRFPNIRIFLIGGELDNSRQALYGPLSESSILKYRANKAFIGAAGVSLTHGLSSNDEKEATTTLKMAHAAEEVFLLVDSEKIGKTAFVNYANIDIVDHIVTNENVNSDFVRDCQDANIDLVLAK